MSFAPAAPILALLAVSFVACQHPTSTSSPLPDPATKTVSSTPTPTPNPNPSPTPSPSPSPSAGPIDALLCESPVNCGVWSECTFFERVDVDRFRATSGSWKGHMFERKLDCYPADGGPSDCGRYCTGPGGTGTCVDGLHLTLEACKATAKPHPSDVRCAVKDGECVRVK